MSRREWSGWGCWEGSELYYRILWVARDIAWSLGSNEGLPYKCL